MEFMEFDDSAATGSGGGGKSWFELALGAYTQIEVAKNKNTGMFAQPYQPVTYGTQPGAIAFDLKNLREGIAQATGIPSGVLVAGVLALLGFAVYRLAK